MDLLTIDQHNKKVEEDVAKGRPDGQIQLAGVMCTECFNRDKTEVEMHIPDSQPRRAKRNITYSSVFCPNCKKSFWKAN